MLYPESDKLTMMDSPDASSDIFRAINTHWFHFLHFARCFDRLRVQIFDASIFSIPASSKSCSVSGKSRFGVSNDINGSVDSTELLKWQTDKLVLLDSNGFQLNSASFAMIYKKTKHMVTKSYGFIHSDYLIS